ncbi:MAG: DUF177 domain-containing protein [Desulfobacteraceae bacterium]|jgi:uncharacterized protein
MMRIHLDQLTERELLLEFEEKPETFPVLADMIKQKECDVLVPIKIRLRIYQISDIIEVEGNLETRVRLFCSRCLQAYETQLASRFDLTYTRSIPEDIEASDHQKELELKAQDLGLIFFNGEEIDLTEGIQEQAVLAFPIRPLCQQQCKGLCSKCGADLNRENCTCHRTPKNSQFAVLKNLKWDNK